jgi:hypothetical protein
LLFTSIAFSCEKEYETSIPNYQVYILLMLDNYDYELNSNTDLAYKIFKPPRFDGERFGFGGGVLVISRMENFSFKLYAYDLACPVEVKRNTHVIPDNLSSSTATIKTAITATCPECGAVFNIANGTGAPQSGTKFYLRSYKVVGSGMRYTVTN